jgi:hypothetical protein
MIRPASARSSLWGGKMRRSIRVLAAMLIALGLFALPTSAFAQATIEQVTITSHMTFNNPNPNTGDFTTSGPATDSGLICPAGTVLDTSLVFGGFQSDRGFQVLVRKTFTCNDGSGTFFVKIQAHAAADGTESFTWVVQGGTGAYESLKGSGTGSSVPNDDPSTGNTNNYEGFLVG